MSRGHAAIAILNRNTILDVDEIAALLAVGAIEPMRLEQSYPFACGDATVILGYETHHVALRYSFAPKTLKSFSPTRHNPRHSACRKAGTPITQRTSGLEHATSFKIADLLAKDAVTIDFDLDKSIPPSAADSRDLGIVVTSIALETK